MQGTVLSQLGPTVAPATHLDAVGELRSRMNGQGYP